MRTERDWNCHGPRTISWGCMRHRPLQRRHPPLTEPLNSKRSSISTSLEHNRCALFRQASKMEWRRKALLGCGPPRLTSKQGRSLFLGSEFLCGDDIIIILYYRPSWTCFLAFHSAGRNWESAIITGNLGRGYLHSGRRATCFNCTLVTYFLRAYRSEFR